MRRIRLPRPSPALVISLIALFVALSGTAYAVTIVPRALLANRALNANKLQGLTANQVAAKPGPASDVGGKTPEQIFQLLQSTPGPASSIKEHLSIESAGWSVNPNQHVRTTASCKPGRRAVGGGFDTAFGLPMVLDSNPTADGTGWQVEVFVVAEGPTQVAAGGSAWVVCAA